MLRLLAKALSLIALFLRRKNPSANVVLMSRQSAHPSKAYQALYHELVARLGKQHVSLCLSSPETESVLGFARGTLRQLEVSSHARVIIIDGYSPAICIPPKNDKAVVIQAWHALGAIKKFGFQSLDTPAGRSSAYAQTLKMHRNYDIIVSAGPGCVDAYAEAFGYPRESITVLGSPDIDALLEQKKRQTIHTSKQIDALLSERDDAAPAILYAPTLRKGPGYEQWIDESLRSLAMHCTEQPAFLLFAGHPLDREVGKQIAASFSCLHIAEDIPTRDLLPYADIVITDYSSIAFEAGLLGKDTCFYVPDIERYRTSPGLNIDWIDQDIGLASTEAGALLGHLLPQPDDFARLKFDEFRAFVAKYFEGVDAYGTQRIADLVCEKLRS